MTVLFHNVLSQGALIHVLYTWAFLICRLQLFKTLLMLHGKKWINLPRFHLYGMSFFAPHCFITSGICTNAESLSLKSLSDLALRCLTEVTALTDIPSHVCCDDTNWFMFSETPLSRFLTVAKMSRSLSGWAVRLTRNWGLFYSKINKYKSSRFELVLYSRWLFPKRA